MSLPTDLVTIEGRRIWGRIYGIGRDTPEFDALGEDAINPRANIVTALCDIRHGSAQIGEILTDPSGTEWTINSVEPADSRYSGSITLGLQRDLIVLQ